MPGKKLLVADDSLTIQKVIRLALSNEGYEIQAISDGADAIQQIATFRPDVVLIDVSLPSSTAFEIKREANGMEEHQGIKFVLMSSAFEKIDEAQASEVGFDGRLTKPFDPAHLRQVLTEVLNAPAPPKSFPKIPASQGPTDMPPLPASLNDAFEMTSTGIAFELPKNLPPSDFEIAKEGEDDELWGRHEESTPPPPLAIPEPSARDEIKQLTESTIRMSGLAEMPASEEEFGWKVNEPSLKPPSSMGDLGGSHFHLGNTTSLAIEEPQPAHEEEAAPRHNTGSAPAFAGGMNESRMEEIIRRQVQETLEKMAQQILPEVAERVIKAEINKLLNEKY